MGYSITTRYAGPTNYRSSRIIGTGPSLTLGGSVTRATVAYSYEGDTESSHRIAAEAVATKLRAAGWTVTVGASATLPDDRGYVFLLAYGVDTA